MDTFIAPTDRADLLRTAVTQAVDFLREGEVVALPSETVYGLAADALNPAAVARIFEAKERPSFDPLIVHLPHRKRLADVAIVPPEIAETVALLIEKFWPGPLTLVLPKADALPESVTGGLSTVAVRMSSHPVFKAVVTSFGGPLAAPSANRFGRVSPTTAQHVCDEFGTAVLVLDGGPCAVGIESSIVDCTRGQPVLLRPGVLTRAQLEAACGERVLSKDEADQRLLGSASPRAPGTLASHYAPSAKVRLMDAKAIQTALDLLGSDAAHIAVYARSIVRIKSEKVLYRRMPDDALAAAQQLFAVLRDFDAQGVKLIWVENLPNAGEWDGVRDRLMRAAAT